MPQRDRPISKRSAISSAVLRRWRHCPKGRRGTDGRSSCNWHRGLSLFTAKGFEATEAAEAYTRGRELAEQRGDPHQLFMAVYGLWQSANGAGIVLDCRRLSNQLQQLTADSADDELRLQAHHSAWATCLFLGEPAAAREHCEAGSRLYDPERHSLHHQLYGGHDPGSCAGYFGAQAHWLLGYPDKGLALGSEALELAERIGHPFSIAIALQFNSMLHLDRGEPELALQQARRRPRRSPPSNGLASCWNHSSCAVPR